jgi:DNA modification methylase
VEEGCTVKPYYADSWLSVYQGDCREVLPTLADASVDCVVTSPPFWGLRDYGHADQLGLESTLEQYVANLVAVFRELRRVLKPSGTVWLNLGSSFASGDIGPNQSRRRQRAPAYGTDGTGRRDSQDLGSSYSDLCDGCRAALSRHIPDKLQPLPDASQPPLLTGRDSEPRGSEPVPLGASPLGVQESTTPQSSTPPLGRCSHCGNCGVCLSVLRSSVRDAQECGRKAWLNYPTFKPKDLVPIPWMVAMALQTDGWFLRRDVIWAKPNPMPESVTDRPTSAHEYVFLLTKSARYFYDADAVREPHKWQDGAELLVNPQARQQKRLVERAAAGDSSAVRTQDTYKAAIRGERGKGRYSDVGAEQNYSMSLAGRNLRSIWTIATRPYSGAHFAVFPPELPERCIKAGSSEHGVCQECGAPWERVAERTGATAPNPYDPTRYEGLGKHRGLDRTPSAHSAGWRERSPEASTMTTGWRPTCAHEREPVPAVVLDPFAGSGTVGMVANRLSRRAILIDLNADYITQQMRRNAQTPLGLGGAAL